jgi:hypothetical protein
MDFTDRIKPESSGIITFINAVEKGEYQIPTFQRDVVWERENIKKLWDSIFKFYPIGSLIIWKTKEALEYHRDIGGNEIKESKRDTFNYLLDGQQRTTSLFLSLKGERGDVANEIDFEPTVYIDLTSDFKEDDEYAFNKFFLFMDEIHYEDSGKYRKNKDRNEKYEKGLIVKLFDAYQKYGEIEEALMSNGYSEYNSEPRKTLRNIDSVFKTYQISYIMLQGIEIREVCDIFERINREGKALDVVDIIVAKTYKPGKDGFYLRTLLKDLRKDLEGSQYNQLSDFLIMQILASIIMQDQESKVKNITNIYLSKITSNEIINVWDNTKKAILEMQKFLEERLHLVGPNLIPYGYMYPAVVNFFYKTKEHDFSIIKQWFWSTAFSSDELDSTTKLKKSIQNLVDLRNKKIKEFPKITIYKDELCKQGYGARSAKSRALLALYASMQPCEFSDPARNVLQVVYRQLGDRPNLHHFFPSAHLEKHPEQINFSNSTDSLINIVYLTRMENLKISDGNPLTYLKEFMNKGFDFTIVMKKHLIPLEIIDWINDDNITWGNYDKFIELRMNLIINKIIELMPDVPVEVK